MENVLLFLQNYWFVILLAIIIIAYAILKICVSCSLLNKNSSVYKKLTTWLLQAVIFAESVLGSKSGPAKLSIVYDKFVGKYPVLSTLISFSQFSLLVDEALKTMNVVLSESTDLQKYIESGNKIDYTHCEG